jgi:V8-like Glu-specific endopeptidase
MWSITGNVNKVNMNVIYYDCITAKGNSGSPIFIK